MVSILIVAIGLPLGIILAFSLMSKYPDRVEGWMPWVLGFLMLSELPILYENVAAERYGLGFWLGVVMVLITSGLMIQHFRQRSTR